MRPAQKHSHKKASLEASNNAAKQLFAESKQLKNLKTNIQITSVVGTEGLGI